MTLTPEQIAEGRALVAAADLSTVTIDRYTSEEVGGSDDDDATYCRLEGTDNIEIESDDYSYYTETGALLISLLLNNAPALLDAADDLARIFTCADCGAMFRKTLPDALYEDVTRCTRCVELEVTRAELARYKALLDDIIPVVNRSYPQSYLTVRGLRELLRAHGLEVG